MRRRKDKKGKRTSSYLNSQNQGKLIQKTRKKRILENLWDNAKIFVKLTSQKKVWKKELDWAKHQMIKTTACNIEGGKYKKGHISKPKENKRSRSTF